MKIDDNGILRDATPEEEARILAEREEILENRQPSPEQRIAELEAQNKSLQDQIDLIVSGATS